MARATHLAHWFLLACVASSLLSWLAAQLPQGTIALIAANLIVFLIWAIGWILDDGLIHLTRISPLTYYTSLIMWGIAHTTGLALYLWIYHQNSQL